MNPPRTTAVLTGHRARTVALLRCGIIAGPLFVMIFLLEGATRTDYDPLRHPVSSLQLGGAIGWTQVANFVITGLLTLGFAIGVRPALRTTGRDSTWGPLLIGTVAIGLIGAGVFLTDPVSGYPPGTPAISDYTWHGALHDLFSALTFLGWPAACLVFARRFAGWGQRGWAVYSAATAALFTIAFLLTSQGFSQSPGLVDMAGLLQRTTITIGWTWLTLLAIHLLRTTPTTE